MEQYKIVFKLNGTWSFSVFNYRTEDEKTNKLKEWKDRHVSPYNNIEVIWHGNIEDYNYGNRTQKYSIWNDKSPREENN